MNRLASLPGRFLLLGAAALAYAAITPAVIAQVQQTLVDDVLVFSASQGYQHESNLLRLPLSVSPPRTATGQIPSRSDLISTTSLGVHFERELSLQRLTADASVNLLRYSNNEIYDHTGYNIGARWDWAYGRQWYGVASARASRALASFADLRTSERSLVDIRSLRLEAGYRFTPAWSAVSAFDSATRKVSSLVLQDFDLRSSGLEAGVRWEPLSGADWSLLWRRQDGQHPNEQLFDIRGERLPGLVGNDFIEDRIFTTLSIEPSDKSRLQLEFGYTRRSYERLSQRDFAGPTFAFDFVWKGSDPFSLSAYVRRDLGGINTLTATHIDSRTVGFRPALHLTDKTSFFAAAEHQRLDYTGDPGFLFVADGPRQDRVAALSAGLHYEVRRKIWLSMQLRWERRDSNDPRFVFSNRSIGVTGEVRY